MKPLRKRLRPDWQNALSPDAVAYLRGNNDSFPWTEGISLDAAAELYYEHADEMVAECIAESPPGTRPRLWWRHCAPEMRLRLGGIGNSNSHFSYGEGEYGIPRTRWFWPDDPCFAPTMGRPWREMNWMKGVAPVDPFNPPKFESQAAFLKRHRLFVRGEALRLTEADFAPEVIRRVR